MVIFRVPTCKFSIILRFVEVNLQVDRHLYPAIILVYPGPIDLGGIWVIISAAGCGPSNDEG